MTASTERGFDLVVSSSKDLQPRLYRIELRGSATLIFVLTNVMESAKFSFVRSHKFAARRFMTLIAVDTAPPVHTKNQGF